MDVFAGFHGRVLAAVQQLKHDGVVPHEASVDGITLEPPKDFSHGDLATNAAMVLAKAAGQPPRALAERVSRVFRGCARATLREIPASRASGWRKKGQVVDAAGTPPYDGSIPRRERSRSNGAASRF